VEAIVGHRFAHIKRLQKLDTLKLRDAPGVTRTVTPIKVMLFAVQVNPGVVVSVHTIVTHPVTDPEDRCYLAQAVQHCIFLWHQTVTLVKLGFLTPQIPKRPVITSAIA
jgi:hypothetical protein